jgi:carotenoid cleavage dioxygenase-like enzyme
LPGVFGLFHDFVVTKNYIVFTASPQGLGDLKSTGLDLLLGRQAPGQAITFDNSKPTSFLVFRRDGGNDGQPPTKIDVDTHFNFHYANAFEDANGHLVIDTVR